MHKRILLARLCATRTMLRQPFYNKSMWLSLLWSLCDFELERKMLMNFKPDQGIVHCISVNKFECKFLQLKSRLIIMKHDKFTPHYIIMNFAIEKFRVEKTHLRVNDFDFDSALEMSN